MRNLLVIVVAALALAWLVNPTTASADDRHVVNLQGVIAHVGDAGIVLHTRRGDVRISVVERTEITAGAELLGVDDHPGRLEAGLEADLIVLERNPLEDIGVVQDVLMVVSDGQVVVRRGDWPGQRPVSQD